MPVLFAAARLRCEEWVRFPLTLRVHSIREHYELDRRPGIRDRSWFFPKSGLGIFVAWQEQDRKLYSNVSTQGERTDIITHAPFGYRSLAPGSPLDQLPTRLAKSIDDCPPNLLRLNPPQAILTIDEQAESFRFRNDLIGFGKTFHLSDERTVAISNRPIAAHLLAGIAPEPSGEGWASDQLHGWFLGELSPFRNTRRILGGTIIDIDRDGVRETRHNLAGRWFTEPMDRNVIRGFDDFLSEFEDLADPPFIDIGLSGGRDSRASAAIASHRLLDKIRFRTNEPPKLEGVVARQLVEKLPNFATFRKQQTVAIGSDERHIWKLNTPKTAEVEVYSRAREWARLAEGVVPAVSLYGAPSSAFASSNEFMPTISGAAGESAKAYYWSPRMASGAYARNLGQFVLDVRNPVRERIKTHPLTTQSAYPFIEQAFRDTMRAKVWDAQREATGFGIHGYRFLDYWWFTNRLGAGQSIGYSSDTTILPFMVPEFIAEGMQGLPMERARATLLSRIVEHYRPEWAGVPYFDDIQDKVPPDQVRYYRDRALLWEGELAPGFLEMLRDSPAFCAPYNRDAIVSFFENVNVPPHTKAGLNHKALGLVHRHAFYEMCRDVGARLDRSSCNLAPNSTIRDQHQLIVGCGREICGP